MATLAKLVSCHSSPQPYMSKFVQGGKNWSGRDRIWGCLDGQCIAGEGHPCKYYVLAVMGLGGWPSPWIKNK
jgi:hypothetical protein